MDKVIRAIDFAARKHKDQRRKDAAQTPYINHPIEVAHILVMAGVNDVDTLCAAILHDTIEDTQTTREELVEAFGVCITHIVGQCSDDKSLSSARRKHLQIEHTESGYLTKEAQLVKLADKYSNLKGLSVSPPVSWTHQQIRWYVIWAYAVCYHLRNVNSILDRDLNAIFESFGVTDQTMKSDLETHLIEYYAWLNGK